MNFKIPPEFIPVLLAILAGLFSIQAFHGDAVPRKVVDPGATSIEVTPIR
jgi:hypothetical protein